MGIKDTKSEYSFEYDFKNLKFTGTINMHNSTMTRISVSKDHPSESKKNE